MDSREGERWSFLVCVSAAVQYFFEWMNWSQVSSQSSCGTPYCSLLTPVDSFSFEESSTTTNGAVGEEDVDDEQKGPPMDDVEENDDEDTTVPASASATTKPRKVQRKYKKAPGAPKRFRSGNKLTNRYLLQTFSEGFGWCRNLTPDFPLSAFILFSQLKHKEIQAMLAERGDSEKVRHWALLLSRNLMEPCRGESFAVA